MSMLTAALVLALSPVPTDCNGNGIDDAQDLLVTPPSAYWRFEQASSPGLDSGPNGLHGVPTAGSTDSEVPASMVLRTSAPNAAARLLGGVGYLTVADPSGLLTRDGSDFTIEAWVRLDQLSTTSGADQRQFLVQKKPLGSADAALDYGVLVQKGGAYSGLAATFGKSGDYTGRELMLLFGTGSAPWAVVSNLQISSTGWHHVSVSHDADAGTVRFSLDGAVETIDAVGPGHVANGGPLLIGAHTNASGALNQFLRGSIDELRILDRVVDPAQLLRAPGMADCNGNGVPDGCDVDDGSSVDCDRNGQPDECQLAGQDCDDNGVPDQCDIDCNGNGVPDACDLASGASEDCQSDGVPDECQLERSVALGYDNGWARIAWRADEPFMGWLNRFNVTQGADRVMAIEVLWGIMPIGTEVDAFVWTDPDGDGNPADASVLWSGAVTVQQTSTISRIEVPAVDVGEEGASFFVGFLMPVTTEMFPGSLDIDGVPIPDRSWGIGSFSPIDPNDLSAGTTEFGTINDLLFGNTWVLRADMRGPGTDCNANGLPDDCDLAAGTSADADDDGRPDECGDCNGNRVLDGFEIADGTSLDCNADRIPDDCQLGAGDCNDDGVPDVCQLAAGDCDGNAILDACDIASGYATDFDGSGVPDACEDCNRNGELDSIDLATGTSPDCNDDLLPDECAVGLPSEPVRYIHDDGMQEANINFVGATLEFAWMNRFIVQPGGEWISAVEAVFGDTYPDLPARVVVWSDPDGNGSPSDARVLVTGETRSSKIDAPLDNVNLVPVTPTYIGPPGTSFFVGVNFDDIWASGKPVAIDVDPPHSGQGWIAYALTGSLDIDNLAATWIMHWPHHDLLVRAVGSSGRFEHDCNANQVLDECDLADGQATDGNGDGVIDQCQGCQADLDGNGQVDGADLGVVLSAWGNRSGPADLNGDGAIDGADLGIMLVSWGPCR